MKHDDGSGRGARSISRRDLLRGLASVGCAAAASSVVRANESQIIPARTPVRVGLVGDWGTGKPEQMAIAERMAAAHASAPLDLVIGAGDNIYPDGSPERFGKCFERPFEALIRRDVPFYTCLGNHDVDGAQAQMRYPLFNMGGESYYTKAAGNGMVEFFMLDSNAFDSRQLAWLERALTTSSAVWKVPVFHHPLYSSARAHGSDESLRRVLEPVFVRHGVKVAFSGHDHVYQRVTPQQGVQYFVSGSGGKLREGNIEHDRYVAAGYDEDCHFMLLDVTSSRFAFKAINTRGLTVDSGEIAAPETAMTGLLKRLARAA